MQVIKSQQGVGGSNEQLYIELTIKSEWRNECHSIAFHKAWWNSCSWEKNREICPQLWKLQTLWRWEGPCWHACECYVCVSGKEAVSADMIVSVSGLEMLPVSLWKTDMADCLVAVWQWCKPFSESVASLWQIKGKRGCTFSSTRNVFVFWNFVFCKMYFKQCPALDYTAIC